MALAVGASLVAGLFVGGLPEDAKIGVAALVLGTAIVFVV